MANPLTLVVGVHLVLIEEDHVLLGLRRNTPYAAGLWHVPAGHLEAGETVTHAMTREADEELGITIAPDDLRLVHTLHHLDPDDGADRLQLFFRPVRYEGDADNREPEKCDRLAWWPLGRLPGNTVDYTVQALDEIRRGSPLSVAGRPL
ncbi:NUDIX domain-containing protein [Kitasatospora sp. NPDC048722]|uniref:NUDIX hydrolase n=1 Tax=Kitasatospora sp. NPDC048722 TaxID=3155639 RepID=UPI0033E26906